MAAAYPSAIIQVVSLQIQGHFKLGGNWVSMIKGATINAPWYALRVQQRLAKAVSISLRGKGYEEFLPLCHSRSDLIGSGNRKQQDTPLFPGYLFCRFDVRDRLLPILTTPGVMSIVGIGKTPVPVSDEEIDSIKTVIRSGLHSKAAPFLPNGSKVVLETGPLSGLEGVVIGFAESCHLIVSVTLLHRSISVEIDSSWVSLAPSIRSFIPLVVERRTTSTRDYGA